MHAIMRRCFLLLSCMKSRLCSQLLAVALAFAVPCALAQDSSALPEMGSSAGELLTPGQERTYGAMMLRQLRGHGLVLDDPLLEGYVQGLGYRLASHSDQPRQPFTFFTMRSRQINAFASIGGFIGINAGLILTAEREDEVAAVLAHEIAHITQRHVLRAVEQAKRDQLPIMLGMLGAILAASQSDSGDGVQAAIMGGMSLMQQRQINYTRANEHEADRLGIQILARAGYEPSAMADFFGRMERSTRGNQGGIQVPEYLRSHPVTTTRISEAKARAEQLQASTPCAAGNPACTPALRIATRQLGNPLLPDHVRDAIDHDEALPELFDLARERLRVLSARSPREAVTEYQRMQRADPEGFSPAQHYGMALAQSLSGQTEPAAGTLEKLAREPARHYWFDLALAENAHRAGQPQLAQQRYEALLARHPHNSAITLSYAASLAERGDVESARKAQSLLRPMLNDHGNDPALQRAFARASEIAGDTVRAAEAHAELAWLNGRPDDALNQLERLRKEADLDFYQRARVDARIAAMTPDALEMRRQIQREGGRRFDRHAH